MDAWGELAFDNDGGCDWAYDNWVAAHPLEPSSELVTRAASAIDRILGDESELRDLWEEGDGGAAWRAAVEDLRRRVVRSKI